MRSQETKYASARAVFKKYFSYAKLYPYLLAISIFGTFGAQIADLVTPWFLRDLINTLAKSQPDPAMINGLLTVVGLITASWFVRWSMYRMRDWAFMYFESNVMRDLYGSSFQYLLRHSYAFFVSRFSGSLTHKINKFSRAFEILADSLLLSFFPTFVFVFGAVVALYIRHPLLGIMLLAWSVAFVAFQVYVAILRQPIRTARANAETRITAALSDAISNQPTILQFSGVAYERSLFKSVVGTWYQNLQQAWKIDNAIWAGMGFFMLIINIALLWAAIVLWSQGSLQVGDFILIQAYLFTTFERLLNINRELRRCFDAFADASEMVALLEEPHGVRDVAYAKPLAVREGRIRFDDVTFSFNEARPVLEHFSLDIRPGEKVAIVGPSGAGKSTITKLMLRMYDIDAGDIEVDGQDIEHVTQESVRDAMSYVPQEPILFHRSLMENIRYGRREATDAEVVEAAKKAHCHEFITRLPAQYGTFVGERGVKLSGGERQRVAIARAILKNAPILLLDEATSSLDSESEALIQDALAATMEGKTVIVIAHRLSTIMRMDRIVVIDNGKIAEEGTHQQLLERGGLYAAHWSRQAGGFMPVETVDTVQLDG